MEQRNRGPLRVACRTKRVNALSRKRAKEAIEVLIEKGVAIPCKVAKGRGNRELDGFQLAHSDENE